MDLVKREGVYLPSPMEAIAILLNPNIDRWGKLRKPVDLLSWCLKFIENCISPAENVLISVNFLNDFPPTATLVYN